MSKRFVPVQDPERPRNEQDEESLRKHRQFDTPFALLAKDLNNNTRDKQDCAPLGRPTGELELDQEGLWRKKAQLFDKEKTWGRETVEYSNPEQARSEGNEGPKWGRPGVVGWGVQGRFGGKGEDNGIQVLQRGEVDQGMVKNEKGLWVRKSSGQRSAGQDHEVSPVPEGQWRCNGCNAKNEKVRRFCRKCDEPRSTAAVADILKAKDGEDPRLEAAKQKGRGTADAQKEALKALHERRNKEMKVKEGLGMMSRPQSGVSRESAGGRVVTLNSSSQQVRPAKRVRKYQQWQTVQTSDEEARRVVEKAIGHATIGSTSAPPAAAQVAPAAPARARSASPGGDCSISCSSRSGSASLSPARRNRRRSPSAQPGKGGGGEVVVDFF